jgi:Rrf2 family nitric oxide-sensitive transcriptional repressor
MHIIRERASVNLPPDFSGRPSRARHLRASDPVLRLQLASGDLSGLPSWTDGLVDEISRAFGISHQHLIKVVQTLTDLGGVEAQRGRGGGMRLAMLPAEINIGWLIRQAEPHFNLVECFDPGTNTCPIAPACGLKGALLRAQLAFLGVLDEYSLDQLLTQRSDLIALFISDSLRRDAGTDDAGAG